MNNSLIWLLLGICTLAQLPGGQVRALPSAIPLGTQLFWVPSGHLRGVAHPYKALNHPDKGSKGGGKMSRVTRQAPALHHQPVKRATPVQVFTRLPFEHIQCVKDDCQNLGGILLGNQD